MMSASYAYELQLSLDTIDETQKQKVIDEAIECYEHTVDFASRESAAKIYSNLGSLRNRKGEYGKALKAYQCSLMRDSTSASTYFNIGNLHAKLCNYELAEDAFLKSIHIAPAYYKPRVSYGWLLQGQGRFKEAKMQYREALEMENLTSENKSNIHANLGLIYHEIFVDDEHVSASDDAVHHYNLALSLNPANKEANEFLPILQCRKSKDFLKRRDDCFPPKKRAKRWLRTLFLFNFIFGFLIFLGKIPF